MTTNPSNQENGNEHPPQMLEWLFASSEPTEEELCNYTLNRLDLEERDRIMRMIVRSEAAQKRLREIQESLAQRISPTISKSLPEFEARTRLISPTQTPILKKLISVAATVLVFCALALGSVKAIKLYQESLHEIANLRQEVERVQNQYDQAWATLQFEEVIKPTIRVLPPEAGGRPNLIRIELSPRIEEGLVRDVSVYWGDAGETWEPIYETEGTIKNFQVIHEYPMAPEGQTSSWTLRVLYNIPDAVAAARRLTPEQLTTSCRVEVTTEGIRLLPVTDTDRPTPQIVLGIQSQVEWLSPQSGTEVGWNTVVTLKSTETTERVTMLVRPSTGTTYYVQPGARSLLANTPELFPVQLAGSPQHDIGSDYDILAICSNNFRPNQWSLEMSDIPHSSVIGRITVRKAAGSIRLTSTGETVPEDHVQVECKICTSYGGILLLREDGKFKVLEMLQPLLAGGKYNKVVQVPPSRGNDIFLLVYREDETQTLQIGQDISEIKVGSYWIYGPAEE